MANKSSLATAIDDLRKNYKQVLREAVQHATEEAQKDVHTRALICLEEYYANYDPLSYRRSDSLRHAIVPYMNIQDGGTQIISTVGVEYNANILASYAGSSYSASKKYGIADANWVIDNYLDGIHPTTNGSRIPEEVVYMEIVDAESPEDKMEDYFESYVGVFHNNVLSYLAAYAMK